MLFRSGLPVSWAHLVFPTRCRDFGLTQHRGFDLDAHPHVLAAGVTVFHHVEGIGLHELHVVRLKGHTALLHAGLQEPFGLGDGILQGEIPVDMADHAGSRGQQGASGKFTYEFRCYFFCNYNITIFFIPMLFILSITSGESSIYNSFNC